MSVIKDILYGFVLMALGFIVFLALIAFAHIFPTVAMVIFFVGVSWFMGCFYRALDEKKNDRA